MPFVSVVNPSAANLLSVRRFLVRLPDNISYAQPHDRLVAFLSLWPVTKSEPSLRESPRSAFRPAQMEYSSTTDNSGISFTALCVRSLTERPLVCPGRSSHLFVDA